MIALRGKLERLQPSSHKDNNNSFDDSPLEWKWMGRWTFGTELPDPMPTSPTACLPFLYTFDCPVMPDQVFKPSAITTTTAEEEEQEVHDNQEEKATTTTTTTTIKAIQPRPTEGSGKKRIASAEKVSVDDDPFDDDADVFVPEDDASVRSIPENKSFKRLKTFADKEHPDDPDFTDACLIHPMKCPPSGAWKGYFETATGRKGPHVKVPETFYLFFNATSAPNVRACFSEDMMRATAGGAGKSIHTMLTPGGMLPPGHLHVCGRGENQYGTFEIVGCYNLETGMLQCQRLYYPLPVLDTTATTTTMVTATPAAATTTPAGTTGTGRRGRGRRRSISSSTDALDASRPMRKRQLSWKRRAACEEEDLPAAATTATTGESHKRGRRASSSTPVGAGAGASISSGGASIGASATATMTPGTTSTRKKRGRSDSAEVDRLVGSSAALAHTPTAADADLTMAALDTEETQAITPGAVTATSPILPRSHEDDDLDALDLDIVMDTALADVTTLTGLTETTITTTATTSSLPKKMPMISVMATATTTTTTTTTATTPTTTTTTTSSVRKRNGSSTTLPTARTSSSGAANTTTTTNSSNSSNVPKLPSVGDPAKARWRAAHFLYYHRQTITETPKDSSNTPTTATGESKSSDATTTTTPAATAAASSATGPNTTTTTNSNKGATEQIKYVIYEGEMLNSQRHGKGICLYNNGQLYEGEWRRDKEHGQGTLMSADRKRIIYKGNFEKGRIHGYGAYYYYQTSNTANARKGGGGGGGKKASAAAAAVAGTTPSSTATPVGAAAAAATTPSTEKTTTTPTPAPIQSRYEGEFKENLRHGSGIYYLPDGSVYNGMFRDNQFSGRGVFTWPDGSVYDGEWKDGKRHGLGLLRASDGFTYDGMWVDNAMEGRGSATYPGGQQYNGLFSNGRREGRGTILFTNGAVYEGRFRDDAIDGQGTMKMGRTMTVPDRVSHSTTDNTNNEGPVVGPDGVVDDNGPEAGSSTPAAATEDDNNKQDFMIPLSFQSDMGHIHRKAGFTVLGE